MELKPGNISFGQIAEFYYGDLPVELDQACWSGVEDSRNVVLKLIERDETVYGLNTGFGMLANRRIPPEDLAQLQINLVRSHCAGAGPLMCDRVVRLIMMLKAASLARGYSGCRREVIEVIVNCLNANLLPCIPEQGLVGASGDLAPLAHLSLALIGEGEFRVEGKQFDAAAALNANRIDPQAAGKRRVGTAQRHPGFNSSRPVSPA